MFKKKKKKHLKNTPKKHKKLNVFNYKGVKVKKSVKTNGTISGKTKKEAEMLLKKRGIRVTKIYPSIYKTHIKSQKLNEKEFLEFVKFLRINTRNGLQANLIIEKYILINKDKAYLFEKARDIYNKTTSFKDVFDFVYDDSVTAQIIQIAEKNGTVEEAFETIENLISENIRAKKDLGSKLVMPKITLFIGLMIFFNVSYWLIPTFGKVLYVTLKSPPDGVTGIYYKFFYEWMHSEDVGMKGLLLIDAIVIAIYFGFPKTKLFKKILYTIIPMFKRRDAESQSILNYKVLQAMGDAGMPSDEAWLNIAKAGDARAYFIASEVHRGNTLADSMEQFNKIADDKRKREIYNERMGIEDFTHFPEDEITNIMEGDMSSNMYDAFDKIIVTKEDRIRSINEKINAIMPIFFTLLTALIVAALFLNLIMPITLTVLKKFTGG